MNAWEVALGTLRIMLLRMSNLFLRTLREDPSDAELNSHKLLIRAGYIRRTAPGIYTWLPLGLRVLRKIENILRQEMEAAGAQEVHFPALLPAGPYMESGRWEEYGPLLFRLQDRKKGDYLLAPTHEEMFTLLVKDLYSSYKDLPLTLYQIQTKYRDEARPRAGLLRGREFVMKDAYSFDIDEAGLIDSYEAQRAAYIRFFERLGLPFVIVSAVSGAMGGSRSEEFLHPTPVGEDEFVRSAGGYAANVEAVETIAPPEIPWDEDTPLWDIVPTPGTGTIAELIELANGAFPREDRAWEPADTLKHVVLTGIHPDGKREVFVVGLPGDRDVDVKRLAAQMEPLEVEPATAADLEKHPELVPGYIGPGVLGPNSESESAVRYLVDPRVVQGSTWITGANEADKHVVGLVAGRDFTHDGFVECAQVRAGDPAPDGSGPLEIARGIEIGHIFQLGTKYADVLGLSVLDEKGKARTVTMGSYGIGVSRVLAAIAEANHDEKGLAWPAHLAPAQVHLVATGKDEAIFEKAEELAQQWTEAGIEVLFDDRKRVSPGVKFADAELLGMPVVVIVGRGLSKGLVEVRERATDERREVPVDQIFEQVRELVQS